MSRDITWRPQQDSNLRTRLRRAVLYPLSYGGWRTMPSGTPCWPQLEYQAHGSPDTKPMCTHDVPIADNLAP